MRKTPYHSKIVDSKPYRVRFAVSALLGSLALLAFGVAAVPQLVVAQEWANGDIACPAEVPRLETAPGWSLYWHDPCAQNCRPCEDQCFIHPSASPRVYAMADFMPLFRDPSKHLEAAPLVADGTLALGTGDLDSAFAAGARLLAGVSLGDWYRLEFSGLIGYSWSDTAALATTDEYATLRCKSELDGLELNLRRRWRIPQNPLYPAEFSTIVGVRYLQIDEELNYFGRLGAEAAPTAMSAAGVEADNALWGAQLGCLSQFLVQDRAWVDVELKGGIFNNFAKVQSSYTVTPGTTTAFTGEKDVTAFVGDLSLMFNYQFARAWTFRAGYTAMWVTGLALAAENASTDPTTASVEVLHSGFTVYHGPSIGLVWAR
jgi:hypothetical protein